MLVASSTTSTWYGLANAAGGMTHGSGMRMLVPTSVGLSKSICQTQSPFLSADSSRCAVHVKFQNEQGPAAARSLAKGGLASVDEDEKNAQRRQGLKAQLLEELDACNTNLSEGSIKIIEELESLNPTENPLGDSRGLWKGTFETLNSSMQGVLYKGAIVTIGRATFNAFGPLDLEIEMRDVINEVARGDDDSYDVTILFYVHKEGGSKLKGALINRAKFEAEGEKRLNIVFKSSTLQPILESKDELKEWLELFKDANDGIDDNGVCEKVLPPAKGWIDITYVDHDFRLTRGNFGTIVIVRRLPEDHNTLEFL